MGGPTDSFLAHYGVLGMKWGKHKAKTPSADYARTKATKKNPHRVLTNDELQTAITRMNLEQQYNKLNPRGFSKGQKTVVSLLAIGTTVNTAIAFANSPAGKAIKTMIKRGVSVKK